MISRIDAVTAVYVLSACRCPDQLIWNTFVETSGAVWNLVHQISLRKLADASMVTENTDVPLAGDQDTSEYQNSNVSDTKDS
jgi:hypothetical protein